MNLTLTRRDLMRSALSASAFFAGQAVVSASAQPRVEVAKLLYGFAPGGPVDALSRRIAEQLAGSYARSAVVDYRTGVGGRLAADALVASPPDGSVMMHGPVGIFTFRPHIEKLAFDPLADVLPVTLTCGFANALAVGPLVPASVKTLADFLQWCAAHPRDASFGSPGIGTPMQLIGTLLARSGGVALTHVPYRQGPVLDVVAGQLASAIALESTVLPFAREGKLRVLATSGPERSPVYPEVPTFAELGHKDLVVRDWWAVFVPARTPSETADRLAREIHRLLERPESSDMLVAQGLQPASSSPAELQALVRREFAHWAEVIRATGFAAGS